MQQEQALWITGIKNMVTSKHHKTDEKYPFCGARFSINDWFFKTANARNRPRLFCCFGGTGLDHFVDICPFLMIDRSKRADSGTILFFGIESLGIRDQS